MAPTHSQFGRTQTGQPVLLKQNTKTNSVAFPNCNMRGGLCETLLASIPMAIIVIQFIRDGYEVVQDGIITLANDTATAVYAPDHDKLTGMLFLPTCSKVLPFGAWYRCLWVASSGKSETLIYTDENGINKSLAIATYGDGLLLSLSISPETKSNDMKQNRSYLIKA
jgi:hypothetical protein